MNLDKRRPITDGELAELMARMDQAEQAGMFGGLFCREYAAHEPAASKEQLVQSISPSMNLTKGFFKRVYGYDLTWPGFADQVTKALEAAGCSRAREYYDMVVGECEKQYEGSLEGVATWYAGECAKDWEKGQKEGEEQRKQREVEPMKPKYTPKWMKGLY
ncbi:hypothetical protein [Clostridium sp. AN503]|uniref:hypothetical protein n=1 Tax=Clostridium sp. AN503 TaxID=3160598 RepID=UPI0034584C2D